MELVRAVVALVVLSSLMWTNSGVEFIGEADMHEEQKLHKFSYEHHQLWQVTLNDSKEVGILRSLETKRYINTWKSKGDHADILIDPHQLDEVRETLKRQRVKFKISIENLQAVIDRDASKEHEYASKNVGQAMSWKTYHRLDTIYGYLWDLAQKFPEVCTVQSIGTTAGNREILLLRISNGKPNNRRIWVDGGIHARDWITPAAATFFIHNIMHESHKQLLFMKNIDWYIVPVLNPDGYEYSHTSNRLWRKNRAINNRTHGGGGNRTRGKCRGVDLNKNFGYQWNARDVSPLIVEPCSNKYRGPTPFSEPESAAVAKFFLRNAGSKWWGFINMHAYGQQILYPWGIEDAHLPNELELRHTAIKAAEKIARVTGSTYEVVRMKDAFAGASGTITDWARGSVGIKYTFMLALRDEGQTGFLLPHEQIHVAAREAWLAVETIAEAIDQDDSST